MQTQTDPDHGHHDSRASGEALLVYAILSRAIQDLFGTVATNDTVGGVVIVKREAMAFLTHERGPWAEQRATFCNLVGLDPDVLRARIIKILEGDDATLAAYSGGRDVSQIDLARRDWAERPRTPHIPVPRRVIVPAPKAPTFTDQQNSERDQVRTMLLRMLAHGPTTSKELSAATGGAVTGAQVGAFLYHAEQKGHVERNGEIWSLKSPQLPVEAHSG